MNGKEYTLKGTLEERVNKEGKPYTALILKLAPNYEKMVFFR